MKFQRLLFGSSKNKMGHTVGQNTKSKIANRISIRINTEHFNIFNC